MTIFEFNLFGVHIAPTYYGLAYAIGIYSAYIWIQKRKLFDEKMLDTLLYTVVAGIILGGRLGYVCFYNSSYYFQNPQKILAIYEGGMSFHGGIIGVIIGLVLFSRYYKKPLLQISDAVAITIPIGIFLGRIANYLNGELRGYAGYTGPFAMYHNGISHFPSPLLEAVLEGGILGGILLFLKKKFPDTTGVISGAFLFGYGFMRLVVEFWFRLPDAQIGYIAKFFTLGQLLSIPLLVLGGYILIIAFQKNNTLTIKE